MKTYTIKKTYPFDEFSKEVEIFSNSLLYTEIMDTHSGVHVANGKNEQLIHEKCRQVADLIREIDELNK